MITARRMESPSSINIYKQCPRKYYYQYILKLDTIPNIHCVRGNVVHSVLEYFFDADTAPLDWTNYKQPLRARLQSLLIQEWTKKKEEFDTLPISEDQKTFYFTESMMMIINWFEKLATTLEKKQHLPFEQAFKEITPKREEEYRSENLFVRGFIDAIEHVDNTVRLMDYKTSKKFKITEQYRLQLAIYAVLYKEKHDVLPNLAGIYFLKDTDKHEHLVEIDEALLEWARMEIKLMHMNTQSSNLEDYPVNITPLCKWSTGQCDFYNRCTKER